MERAPLDAGGTNAELVRPGLHLLARGRFLLAESRVFVPTMAMRRIGLL